MNLRNQPFILRLSFDYDGWNNVTTVFATKHYAHGMTQDCGMGSARGRDEAGAVASLRTSRHNVKDLAAIADWRRSRMAVGT